MVVSIGWLSTVLLLWSYPAATVAQDICTNATVTITANGSLTLGEKYSLSCTASCLARVTSQSIQWVSPEGTLITRAVSNSMATSTLTFSPLGFSDAGEYTCQLVGGASTEAVETWIVEVEIPSPSVTVGHDAGNTFIYAGSVLTLICTSQAPPSLSGLLEELTVTATWTGPDSGQLTDTSRSTVSPIAQHDGDGLYTSTVTYDTLRTSDTGSYTCSVTYGPIAPHTHVTSGEGTGHVTINVIAPTIVLSLSPDHAIRLPAESPYNTYAIVCTATTPDTVVTSTSFTWTRIDEGVEVIKDNGDSVMIEYANLDQPTSTSTLHLVQDTPGNYQYLCQAALQQLNIRRRLVYLFPIEITGPSTPQFTTLSVADLQYNAATIQWTVLEIAYTPELYVVKYGMNTDALMESSELQKSGSDFSATGLMFKTQIIGLSPDTLYYYQLVAKNSFSSTSSPVMSFRTSELLAGPEIFWTPLSENAVRIDWRQPVVSDAVLYFTVNLTRYHDGREVASRDVSASDGYTVVFNSSQLTPGVPYNVTIVADAVSPSTITNFTDILAATAPGGVSAERNGTEMVVSWRRLTLVEARGFVQYYIINISGGIGTQQNRQQSGAGGVCNATHSLCLAPESASSVTVTGLEPSSSYAVTVAAASGVQSPPRDLPLAMEEGEVLIGEQSEPVTVSGAIPPSADGDEQLFGVDIIWIMVAIAVPVLLAIIIVVVLLVCLVARRRRQAKLELLRQQNSREERTTARVGGVNSMSNSYESPYVYETMKHAYEPPPKSYGEKQPQDYEVPVSSLESIVKPLNEEEPRDYEIPTFSAHGPVELLPRVYQPIIREEVVQHEYAVPIIKAPPHAPDGRKLPVGAKGASSPVPIYVNQQQLEAVPAGHTPACLPQSVRLARPTARASPDPGLLSTSVVFYETASL